MMITTIVTPFFMKKTMQKGNDDRKCDKKPTFYENYNLSTGIIILPTETIPQNYHPFASTLIFSQNGSHFMIPVSHHIHHRFFLITLSPIIMVQWKIIYIP